MSTGTASQQVMAADSSSDGASAAVVAARARSPLATLRLAFEWTVGLAVVVAHFVFLYSMYEYYSNTFEERVIDPAAPPFRSFPKVFDYVSLWTPIFLLSILVEWVYADLIMGKGVYRTNDTVGSLSLGMVMVISQTVGKLLVGFAPYVWVWDNYAVVRGQWWQQGAVAWWAMFIGVDFAYYWVHRTGHTVNAFWAMHSVHHSSEEYNLSTALRQSAIHSIVSTWYYIPLALFFPPQCFYLHSQFNLLYQFWIHTQTIPKLGPIEWILNTPSQHRVHHGRNAYCIDTNYGGTLSVFDRLFGTFQEEVDEVPVVYGLTHSLNTFSPLEGNIANWRHILYNTWTLPSWKHKFFVWYKGPGWVAGTEPHEEWPIPPCTRDTAVKYNPKMPRLIQVYVLVHFFAMLGVQTMAIEALKEAVDCAAFNTALLGVALSFVSLLSFGFIADRRVWCVAFEGMRLVAVAAFVRHAIAQLPPTHALVGYGQLAMDAVVAGSLLLVIACHAELTAPIDPESELGHDLPNASAAQAKELAAAPVPLKTE